MSIPRVLTGSGFLCGGRMIIEVLLYNPFLDELYSVIGDVYFLTDYRFSDVAVLIGVV